VVIATGLESEGQGLNPGAFRQLLTAYGSGSKFLPWVTLSQFFVPRVGIGQPSLIMGLGLENFP